MGIGQPMVMRRVKGAGMGIVSGFQKNGAVGFKRSGIWGPGRFRAGLLCKPWRPSDSLRHFILRR